MLLSFKVIERKSRLTWWVFLYSKGGGSIPQNTQKRSINFPIKTLETLDKLAAKKHTTTSEIVREYVDKGLAIEGNREDIDFIAQMIRQELTAVYHVDEIKAIVDHDADRLAKMLMKIGKINGAMFFLLLKVLMNLANEGSEDDFDQMIADSVKLGVDYMQKKDFQINSFLQDTGNLRNLSEKI
ncbi:hypothetical protein EDD76_108209 [Kineothrix alysoides]|uniref:Ribbon-helix-helix CopG family protein n=1 Tax=Kineothrix alysoides TaxID=1469948 RepID=A0A4R1QY57_9FIRM|nr:hypothetical protein [Kineothrix alysoides]TCL57674.1 hypothetical protein EDD76_108209 [Kineothrix alysoides]